MTLEYHNIRIQKNFNTLDLEKILKDVHQARLNNQNIALWLPRQFNSMLFCEDLIASIVAISSRTTRNFKIVDWGGLDNEDTAQDAFATSIPGIASVVFSPEITNEKTSLTAALDDNAHDAYIPSEKIIRRIVEEQGSRLEPRPSQFVDSIGDASSVDTVEENRSLTFCAFDDNYPSLRDIDESDSTRFTEILNDYRTKYCESGLGEGYQQRVRRDDIASLGKFVYQLFQNTHQHARHRGQEAITHGLRYFRIKRVSSVGEQELLRRANGYPELQEYLSRTANQIQQGSHYYSISVFDTGAGIIDRFCEMRPDLQNIKPETLDDKIDLLNKIVRDNLSGKPHISGAGKGLEIALGAVSNLNGFLSVRSGSVWAHATDDPQRPFQPTMNSKNIASIEGTIFNLMFPLHQSGSA